ncbi:MAG: cell division protein FtsQ/DivIB [Patescibacteria group bacterium]|nr:cell division protein FtsQ/DivIB [Patescibacteria group bacterium]
MNNHKYFRQPKIYAATPAERKANFSRVIIVMISIFLLLVLFFWFVCFSPYFKIKIITISGSLNPEVGKEIEKFKGKNILFFQIGKIEQQLASRQTSISSLEIFKGIPDTLRIKVNVRTPKIIWQTQGKNYFIDENGVIFELKNDESITQDDNKLPIVIDNKNVPINLGARIITPDFIRYILDLNSNFENKIGTKIKEFHVDETTLQVEVITESGWRALLDTSRDYNTQLIVLKKILDQYKDEIKEYIDLRVEGRAYYK